jgi:hypothetical protein
MATHRSPFRDLGNEGKMTGSTSRLAERWQRPDLQPPRPRIAIETFAGSWKKTNEKQQWIDSLIVESEGDDLYVTIFGSQPPSPASWGRARAETIYSGSIASGDARAGAFAIRYCFDEFDVEVQANLNLGLLVVATFVRFREAGALHDRFTREFFYRVVEGEAS